MKEWNLKPIKYVRAQLGSSQGMVLVVVLWVLVILSMLAMGLSKSVRLEIALTNYYRQQLQLKYCARAGISLAIEKIRQDTLDAVSNQFDSLYQCGFKLKEDEKPKDIFEKIPLAEGHFTLSYRVKSSPLDNIADNQEIFGFSDEESRLNLNALNHETWPIFKNLLEALEVKEKAAKVIAISIVDWIDADSQSVDPNISGEDDAYLKLNKPYRCKNTPFDSLQELLLVQGMTPEIFLKIKPYVTVFPKNPQGLFFNVNTAMSPVILSFASFLAGPASNTTVADAQGMAKKILEFRSGEDGLPGNKDDRIVDFNKIGFNEKEKVLYLSLTRFVTNVSNFIRVRSIGQMKGSELQLSIEAIIDRQKSSIVFWERS